MENSKKMIESNISAIKQSSLDKDSLIADLRTQVKLLEQEKELLGTQITTLKKKNQSLSDTSNFKQRISDLDEEVRQLKKQIKAKETTLEDTEFTNSQLQKTISALKAELNELNKKVGEERRSKHQIEIKQIELKDQQSKLYLRSRCLEEDLERVTQELNYVSGQLEAKDQDLKSERRKAAYLEREFEQYKFSTDASIQESQADIQNQLQKIQHLESENKEVSERIQSLIKEHQKRMDDERTSHLKTKNA